MARGFRYAIASKMSASDRAGSAVRSKPLMAERSPRGPVRCGNARSLMPLCHFLERRLDNLFFSEIAAGYVGDDPSVAKNVHVVAMVEFFVFGRVPEERAAFLRLGTNQLVDFELGSDI